MPGHLTNGANLLPLGTTGAGGILLTGNITGATAGPVTVTSFGSGAITLSGANTQTGATTVNSGILRATTNATALGATTSAKCRRDRKSTRLNSSHTVISYAVFCLKKKKNNERTPYQTTHLHR